MDVLRKYEEDLRVILERIEEIPPFDMLDKKAKDELTDRLTEIKADLKKLDQLQKSMWNTIVRNNHTRTGL
jgi:hypothetical protein